MRKIRKWLLLMAPMLACACSQVPGKLLIMEGNFHHARGNYAGAIDSYLRALAYDEAAPYSEFGLGSAYFAMGEEKAALERFTGAGHMLESAYSTAGQELQYRIHYNTGVVLFSEGNFTGAVDSFREALKIDGGRNEAKRNLELSLRSLARENKTVDGGHNTGGERMDALVDYIQQKELNRWKSRHWQNEAETEGPDY